MRRNFIAPPAGLRASGESSSMRRERSMTKEWYYAEGDKPVGPILLADLISVLSRVSKAESVLVWRDGFPDWMQASNVPELAPHLIGPPPLTVLSTGSRPAAVWASSEDAMAAARYASSVLHPWRRHFARMIDIYFFSVLSVFLLALFPKMEIGNVIGAFVLDTLISLTLYIVLEAICLNVFGATLGKFLYGIQVTTKKGERLRFLTAMERSFLVWMRGLGLGIPPLNFITEIVAYNNLLKNGQTSWDRDLRCNVTHRDPSMLRWIIIGLIWLVISAAFFAVLYVALVATLAQH
jgi:RDD family/GYF domain 2